MISRSVTRPVSRSVSRAVSSKLTMPIPGTLFMDGENGAWYDPSDLSTLFQDAEGTIPVTTDGDPVGLMQDKSGNGKHATQPISASRPIYRTDGTLHWLSGDGIDDSLVSSSMTWGTNLVTVHSGFRKLTNGAGTALTYGNYLTNGWLIGLGAFSEGTDAFVVNWNDDSLRSHSNIYPETALWSGKYNGAQLSFYKNGAALDEHRRVLPNFKAGLLRIFSRDSAGAVLKGNFYGCVVVSRSLQAWEDSKVLAYLAKKSGVTL